MKKILSIIVAFTALSLGAKTWQEVYTDYNTIVANGTQPHLAADQLAKANSDIAKEVYLEVKDKAFLCFDHRVDAGSTQEWEALSADQKKEFFAKASVAIRYVIHNALYDDCLAFAISWTPYNVAKAKSKDFYNGLKEAGFKNSEGRIYNINACLELSFLFEDYDFLISQDPTKLGPTAWGLIVKACGKTKNYEAALSVLTKIKQEALERNLENHSVYAKATALQKFVTNEMLLNKFSK